MCFYINVMITKMKESENISKEQLQINEQRYSSLLNSLDAGVVVHALDTKLIYNNSRASELFGLTDDQMIGKQAKNPNWKFLDEFNNPLLVDDYPVNRIISTMTPLKNMMLGIVRPKMNDVIWVLANGCPIKDEEAKVIEIIISFIDITDRRQVEEELRQSLTREQLQADIVRKAPVAIAFGYPDGRLDNCNKAFIDLTGYTENELKNINWNEVLTPSKWNEIEAKELKKLTPENNNIRYEKEYIHKEGQIIPIELIVTAEFDDKNNLVYFIGFIRDITDRKLAEDALKISELKHKNQANFLDTTIDNSPFAMWISDTNGLLIRANQALREILNVTDDKIVKKYNVLQDQNLKEQGLLESVQAVFNDLKPVRFTMFWMGNKIGSGLKYKESNDIWIDASMFPILDKKGDLTNVVCQYVDITDRKKAEQELAKHQDDLEKLVNERTYELKAKNKKLDDAMKVFVGREIKIKQLQDIIKTLEGN